MKQSGKFYSGTIVAVGTKADIEQRWKELEGGEDSDSSTAQEQGNFHVNQCLHACKYM